MLNISVKKAETKTMMLRSILFFSLTFCLEYSHAETRVLNDDGTTTIIYDDGEVEQRLRDAEQRRLQEMSTRMLSGTPPSNSGGSVTRMAQGCRDVPTPEGVLQVCDLTLGGVSGDTRVYLLDGEEYNGRVRENSDGTFTITPNGALETESLRRGAYSGPTLPPQFDCNNNGQEFQCLVCSCFFEARGQTYPERVRIGRTKFSRVLNHNFSNNVCGVVHEVMPAGGAAYSWTSQSSDDRFTTRSGEEKRHVDVVLGVDSPDLTESHQRAYRGCVQASTEALQYRNQYFASYYWTREIEGQQTWMNNCIENTSGVDGNLISSLTTPSGERIDFAHNFRRICETTGNRDERSLLSINQSPYAPYHPTVRPTARPRSLD